MGRIPAINQRFTGAYQATEQAQRIAELQAEVEQLRAAQSPDLEAQLEVLREQLKAQSGELSVEVELIYPNPHQPRQTITIESIQTIARSLEKDGQITPLILIPQGERYLLWDGQRRWEAAKLLGWGTLQAVTAPMPKDLHRKALLTFIHHEDLNPLDKAEAIVKEVADSTGIKVDKIPTVLSTVLRRLERGQQINKLTSLVSATPEEQQQGLDQLGISEVETSLLLSLLDLGLNPASVKANLLSMLVLPPDLKQAIREQGLKGAHALALAGLSAKILQLTERQATKERVAATQQVIEQDLTVAKTRELVAQIKARYLDPKPTDSKEITAAARGLEKLSPNVMEATSRDQLKELRQILQQKLAEIDAVLAS
ncbi:MAG TPA: ParB/RepB/Spo0J family partition protein [Leptolyngbyaceae cyanobacterium M33_DOE_097]|uniref:ParB/RepB/Spo0J family partition protein n=1 Tax=Oscillatoriales cyanobacterium SpSt-418 TaxID=2282169 RepID=A0A7C3KDM0_9CYAN|nr:ParB/RepB/Spo0J family partition protein [Leptolyngbyaceae cyanobacterium M33_DOE_097]